MIPKRVSDAKIFHGTTAVAKLLGCTDQHVRNLVDRGELKALITSNRRRLVTHEEAVRFKEQLAAT